MEPRKESELFVQLIKIKTNEKMASNMESNAFA